MTIAAVALLLLSAARAQEDFIQFTPPPAALAGRDRALVDGLRADLTAHPEHAAASLIDPRFAHLHSHTEFRELVRDHVRDWRITIAAEDEPGERLLVAGRIRRDHGAGVSNALVYVYQTSDKGWYSDKGAHVSGNSGDHKHARLFGYLRTDALGRFEIRTVRPAGYPQSDLPAHIHIGITGELGERLGSEIRFNDDPRMTAEQRVASERDGYAMVTPKRDRDGTLAVWVEFTLK